MQKLRSITLAVALVAPTTFAGAIQNADLFTNELAANDDGSTG